MVSKIVAFAISGLDAHPNLPVGSPGNVVDPLDSIAEYGTDALRYALLTSSVGKSQSERFGTIPVFWNGLKIIAPCCMVEMFVYFSY